MEDMPKYGVAVMCENPENKELSLNEYQRRAMTTCMPSCENWSYMSLNLMGELGELCSKVAKLIRKGKARIENNELVMDASVTTAEIIDIRKELGDCYWQLNGLATVLHFDAEDVCRENLDKLASRQQRGKIDGNGDNR